jgi:hypothetical protein
MSTQLDALSTENRGSRFAGQAADEKTVTHLASGGSLAPETRGLPEGWRTVERRSGSPQGGLAGVMRKALVLAVPLWAALPLDAEHVARGMGSLILHGSFASYAAPPGVHAPRGPLRCRVDVYQSVSPRVSRGSARFEVCWVSARL